MTEAFDPDSHHLFETHYFEDFNAGDTFPIPSRTLTDASFQVFQAASGDNHPIHYDREYCRRHGHRDLLAHGFQVAIQTCPGAGQLPHMLGDALVAFIEQSSRFLGPVYAGDTVYPRLTIVELVPQRTTGIIILRSTIHNQNGELVLEGEQKLLVRKRHPAPR
ncbi:MAG: MaoC family dehydratase [Alphaproteobacteria bacterium]|nr:MaoC family dehydratase [Alphaproteobacteria bacterium]